MSSYDMMPDKEYIKSVSDKKETHKRFNKYLKEVCKILDIDKETYRIMEKLIITYSGYFDENETYCGPGWLGDKLVPDLIFKFAGYVHDGIYLLIELGKLSAMSWKKKADKWFFVIMDTKAEDKPWPMNKIYKGLGRVYYTAVMIAGNPKRKKKVRSKCI